MPNFSLCSDWFFFPRLPAAGFLILLWVGSWCQHLERKRASGPAVLTLESSSHGGQPRTVGGGHKPPPPSRRLSRTRPAPGPHGPVGTGRARTQKLGRPPRRACQRTRDAADGGGSGSGEPRRTGIHFRRGVVARGRQPRRAAGATGAQLQRCSHRPQSLQRDCPCVPRAHLPVAPRVLRRVCHQRKLRRVVRETERRPGRDPHRKLPSLLRQRGFAAA